MKLIVPILAAGLGVAGLGISAQSTGGSALPGQHTGPLREIVQTAMRHFLNFRKETPLSAEQRDSVKKILESHRDEIRSQMTKGRDARRAMAEAAKKDPASTETRSAADKIGEVARDRALLMAKIGAEVRPLLTTEQSQLIEAARTEIEPMVDAALARIGG